jgi:hypothetical protein
LLSATLADRRWDRIDLDFLENQQLMTLGHLAAVKDISSLLQMSFYSRKTLLLQLNNADRKGWLASTYTTRYCSKCLEHDQVPHLRRHWRFHFAPVCRTHKTVLHSGCWNEKCRYSLPLLKFSQTAKCPRCNSFLGDAKVITPSNCDRLFQFVDSIETIVRGGQIPLKFGFAHDAKAFFDVLLFLVRYFKLFLPRGITWESELQSMYLPAIAPYDWRKNNAAACVIIEKSLALLENWPNNIKAFEAKNRSKINMIIRGNEGQPPQIITNLLGAIQTQVNRPTNRNASLKQPVKRRYVETLVSDAVDKLIEMGKFPYTKTVCKKAGISRKRLQKPNSLIGIIKKGQVHYREQEKQKLKEAVQVLRSRRLPVTSTAIAVYMEKTYPYVKSKTGQFRH